MNELTKSLIQTEEGITLYNNALAAINDHGMHKLISGGVIVGLSGGADSVALLLVLLEYQKKYGFPIKAIHVNHCIRGKEADSDQAFSKKLCEKLNVDFESFKIDVPALAEKHGLGIEEAARNARYDKFFEILNSDSAFSSIAVAHNATDNLETVIFNMMRGSGIAGITGIRPVRENVVRPLIYSSKELICNALKAAKIDFVVDSTNLCTDYTRNYIRNEILPKFKRISVSPERMCTRLTSTLREDNDYLTHLAEKFIADHQKDGVILKNDLILLKKPIFSRVLMIWAKQYSLPTIEKVHIDSAYSLIQRGDFSISIPGGMQLICSEDKVVISEFPKEKEDFRFSLKEGINKFPGFESIILLSKDKNYDCFLNIYKKSIQAKIRFDIINDGVYIRSKNDGDSYRFDNMTHKLKKLFNDKKISPAKRKDIPVFCDADGIIWVPGFKKRDETQKGEEWYVTILNPIEQYSDKRYFVTANN